MRFFSYVLYNFPKGYPEPNITWTKDSAEIVRSVGQVVYRRWSITLEDSTQKDSGAYTCKVCNLHGCVNHTTQLRVQGKVYEHKSLLLFKCIQSFCERKTNKKFFFKI